jgi:hypothetical protein
MLATFFNFLKSTQRKQSPNMRKFAQTGHPNLNLLIGTRKETSNQSSTCAKINNTLYTIKSSRSSSHYN